MGVVDLVPDLANLVRGSRSDLDFRARFWTWLEGQRQGPLGPLVSDMVRLWSGLPSAPGRSDAEELVRRLQGMGHPERAQDVLRRVTALAGRTPDCEVVLVAGLRRPEGYSRFDRGRNTVFIGLDHPNSLAAIDHFEMILAHELTHALRDPLPSVQADYGGWTSMSHDEFVTRYTFHEHLVSESLATALSSHAYPHKELRRYAYFDAEGWAWCEANRARVAERMLEALEEGEDYRTFYAEGSVAPGSPDCCDYYFGLHLGRFALARAPIAELLELPGRAFLERFLQPFLTEFLGQAPVRPAAAPAVPCGVLEEPLELHVLPPEVKRFYRELMVDLTCHPEETGAQAVALQEAVGRAGLMHGDSPYDVHAFPLVLAAEDEGYLGYVSERLLRVIEKVIDCFRADPAVRAYFALPHHLEELILLEPDYRPLVQVARFDSHWDGRRVSYLELNTHGTAGLVLSERLAALYQELPQAKRVLANHPLRPMRLLWLLAEAIRSAWSQSCAARELGPIPLRRVAIVDWAGVPTRAEQAALRDFLEQEGIPTVLVDPSALSFDGTVLSADGLPVDLVYRRFTTLDLLEQPDRLAPLLDAARAGKVVMFGPFASDLAHSKRLFAFLTDERWRRCFDSEERGLIDAHVPWTRLFRPGRSLYHGQVRDLRELALAERERFVLKPTEGYEGRGVVLGLESSPAAWAQEVARRFGGDHILQEYVPAPVRTLVLPGPQGTVVTSAQHLHLGEYLIAGRQAGFLVRASPERVLSVVSREGALPCLVLRPGEAEAGEVDLNHP